MDDVIENCATTFEEDGVNQQTLDDIRKVRIHLSSVQQYSTIASISKLCHHAQAGVPLRMKDHFFLGFLCALLDPFWSIIAERHFLRKLGNGGGA